MSKILIIEDDWDIVDLISMLSSKSEEIDKVLGLAIVKRIIDLHESSIDVKSTVGKGTSFNFSLPVARIA